MYLASGNNEIAMGNYQRLTPCAENKLGVLRWSELINVLIVGIRRIDRAFQSIK